MYINIYLILVVKCVLICEAQSASTLTKPLLFTVLVSQNTQHTSLKE